MLASADQVAIDAVAAKMMGFDPMTIPYIRSRTRTGSAWATRARSRSWATDVAAESWGFSVGDNGAQLGSAT